MKGYRMSRTGATAIAFGVVAALSFGGVAKAITDSVFRYDTPKTGYYTVGSAAMVPKDTTAGENYSNSASDGGLIVLGQQRCFVTGINLPNAVTITGMRVWYLSGATGNPEVRFLAHVLQTGQASQLAGRIIVDDSGMRKVAAISVPAGQTINNGANAYGLDVCISPDDAFYAARITYTYQTAGD